MLMTIAPFSTKCLPPLSVTGTAIATATLRTSSFNTTQHAQGTGNTNDIAQHHTQHKTQHNQDTTQPRHNTKLKNQQVLDVVSRGASSAHSSFFTKIERGAILDILSLKKALLITFTTWAYMCENFKKSAISFEIWYDEEETRNDYSTTYYFLWCCMLQHDDLID